MRLLLLHGAGLYTAHLNSCRDSLCTTSPLLHYAWQAILLGVLAFVMAFIVLSFCSSVSEFWCVYSCCCVDREPWNRA
jgi:hypothetical protein